MVILVQDYKSEINIHGNLLHFTNYTENELSYIITIIVKKPMLLVAVLINTLDYKKIKCCMPLKGLS